MVNETKTTIKRNLFAELVEGFEALGAERFGKIVLRTIAVEKSNEHGVVLHSCWENKLKETLHKCTQPRLNR
jgi:hypothetical protein